MSTTPTIRRAIVTGSTGGIGLAIARGLARQGMRVVLNGRCAKRIDDAMTTIRSETPDALLSGFAGDLGTTEGVEELVAYEPEADILVNNLGIFERKPLFEIDDEDWQRLFEVNVLSGARLSRHYAPRMASRGWGRVVFVSSISAVQVPPEMVHYGATKAAQLALARGLAETLSRTGVTVNTILPGPTLTEGMADMFAGMAVRGDERPEEVERDFIARNRPTSLLGRLASVDEVASMAIYLASDAASAINGSAFRVDGGIVRHLV
ncbi:NAD(P)-dependent dehydrogenase (short-subunit alcohol dehydrogenase family) [Luteibacter rhizovicinus]|uniref:NAD(P)-dependent dehydrogenase (Short-subunit alcohol dehydrogenase family) n=1 Tax=Luteibacter rhizovicinus TaxID=242606 RepID=A0A4R3YU91_9GAMM|nr:SDR family oxidoreductase [Luteibacter rhizovicinus]TCV96090.1 NAD(P)-dependent dehydrogenase (short-subunit alcohol dehydrogenase family) [Luteibacter rhizovicinus]